MHPRHYLGRTPRLTFTSDFHELLTGDLVPGQTLHVQYDPRRLRIGERIPPVTLHARFRDDGPVTDVPLHSPPGQVEALPDEATTRAAVMRALVDVPEDADFVSLWFTGVAVDGSIRTDDDGGRTFRLGFPSRDIGEVTATVLPAESREGSGVFTVDVAALRGMNRISVRYHVVNDPVQAKGEFDLAPGSTPDAEGHAVWTGRAPVPSAKSVVRFKIHYWIDGERFKEDNASAYFLAPAPPREDVPPPPAALMEAARAFASPPSSDS